MPPRKSSNQSKKVETIKHEEAKRRNIPTAEHQSVMAEDEKSPIRVAYDRRNCDLDPQLVWRGKDEQDWSELVVSAPPLYIQEKVHPKAIVDDLVNSDQWLVNSGKKLGTNHSPLTTQLDLFSDFNGLPKDATATEFYQHDANWTNRMILGDSLQVMASLAEREGLRGKVQCIYFDPPYGIKFNSNFQWSTTSRDVKDGKLDQITREPEQVKAFRDTWRDGIHSYLTYLRDRLTVARDLLTDSGSIFVQIGDENVHRVRAVMDEVFGEENYSSLISFVTTGGVKQNFLSSRCDYLLWYFKNKAQAKYRRLYLEKNVEDGSAKTYTWVDFNGLNRRGLTAIEKTTALLPENGRLYRPGNITTQGNPVFDFTYLGKTYSRPWKTTEVGMSRVGKANRLHVAANSLSQVNYLDDFPVLEVTALWTDTFLGSFSEDKQYIVQTSQKTIQRCILITTDPGDLVLDPTCVRRGTRVLSPPKSPPKSPRKRGDFEDSCLQGDFEDFSYKQTDLENSCPLPLQGEGWGGGILIPIEDLKPGDRIYSHDGKPHRVLRTIAKPYQGQMIGIKHNQSNTTLWLTAEHLVLAKLRPRTLGGNRDWSGSPYHSLENRKRLRKEMTPPERKLWSCLQGKQLGHKFRRQHPIGHYIADFYSRDANLVVEVDGATHFTPEAIEYDRERDRYMRHLGLDVLRFTSKEVESNLEGVCLAIQSHCHLRTQRIEDAEWVQAGALQPGDVVFSLLPPLNPPLNPPVNGGTLRNFPINNLAPSPLRGRAGVGENPCITGVLITEIQTEYTEETVYDLEVEDAHSFLTEVCVVHNCGSGTTAYVAEQWGRRWITIDTSRVALALARARIMGARYPYYLLADSPEGQQKEAELSGKWTVNSRYQLTTNHSSLTTSNNIRLGFVYDRVPHITLKSIANNTEIDTIWELYQTKLEPLREALNRVLSEEWLVNSKKSDLTTNNSPLTTTHTPLEEWEIPREIPSHWPLSTHQLHSDWWKNRIARQKEIDASIAAKADQEFLYDKPYEDKNIMRVAGPFTVESLSPHRVLAVDENDDLIDPEAKPERNNSEIDFVNVILENLNTSGVQQPHKEDKINFTSLVPFPSQYICAEGRFLVNSEEWIVDSKKSDLTTNNSPLTTIEKRAGIFIGSEFGTVSRPNLVAAAREAGDLGFDVLITCAFNYDAHSAEFNKLGRIPILKARMNADLHMANDLKNTGAGNLFVIFGEPDILVASEEWLVDSLGVMVAPYEIFKLVSGANSLAEINRLSREDLLNYTKLSCRREIWDYITNAASSNIDPSQHSRGASPTDNWRISSVSWHCARLSSGSRNVSDFIRQAHLSNQPRFQELIERLYGDQKNAKRTPEITGEVNSGQGLMESKKSDLSTNH